MPPGRPTKYHKDFDDQAYKLCLLGFTHEKLAKYFEVDKDTITEWINKHEEFSVSVTRGKDQADADVAQSFHKRAVGYEYTETQEESRNGIVVSVKTTNKEVIPDAGAALNWLKNRQPDLWRDKKEIETTMPDLSKLTEEELLTFKALHDKIGNE